MNPLHVHTIQSGNLRYNYVKFRNVLDFNSFVEQEPLNHANKEVWKTTVNSASLKLQKRTTWYGTPSPKTLEELANHQQFSGMHLLEKVQVKIQSTLAQYLEALNENTFSKPKIAYNQRGQGIFSFDRATMGLAKMHQVNRGTPLETATSQLQIELGQKQIITQTKDVFAYFENKETSLPSLRLYVQSGANANTQGNELLYVGLSTAILVKFMEERGVAVEVNAIIGTSFTNTINQAIITLKHFHERLDKNQLLLMTADPRYFRFQGFKALIALSNYFGLNIPNSLGSIQKEMGQNLVKLLPQKGFVFEQSYSLTQACKEVERIITTYKQQVK